MGKVVADPKLKQQRRLGWLLIAGGVPFLLLDIGVIMFAPWLPLSQLPLFLLRAESVMVALSGATGASLMTAGARRLGAPTQGHLVAVWGVAFLFATVSSRVAFLMIDVMFGSIPLSELLGRSLLRWRTAAPIGVVIVLFALSVVRSLTADPHPHLRPNVRTMVTEIASWLTMIAVFLGLPTLGAAAWFVGPPLFAHALGVVPRHGLGPFGMLTLASAPIGLVAGFLAGLWVYAADGAQRRLRRCAIAALALIALPLLLLVVLRATR